MDGTKDLSALSNAELEAAKAETDPSLSPLDHARLVTELRRRSRDRARARSPHILKIIGVFLVLGSIAVLAATPAVLHLRPTRISVSLPILLVVPIALWAVAGILLIAGRRIGIWLAGACLSLQLVSFAVGNVSFLFRPLIGTQVAWVAGDVLLTVGVGPAAHLRLGQVESTQFALDLVAIVGLYFVLEALWTKPAPVADALQRPEDTRVHTR